MTNPDLRTLADGVRAAAARLRGIAIHTPLLENEILNDRVGARILLKAEVFQHCGSFKFRGAFNRLSKMTNAERVRGVMAWSSGNHGQGVARAARHFGVPATIVMPIDAPEIKAQNVAAYGAEIITYDRYKEDREAIAISIAEKRGMALAPSYDHIDIIEGQGTVALEAVADAAKLGVQFDAFVICCGGGGLTSGCATILADVAPGAKVWISEPEGYDETWRSIRDGKRRYADVSQKTICDAIATPTPGELTLEIMKRLVTDGASVSEQDVTDAILFAFKTLKVVLEPGGAAALAAILSGKFDISGKTIGVTLSGGNVDPQLFASILNNSPQ